MERRLARVVAGQASGLRRRSSGLARVAHSSDVGGVDRARSPHAVRERNAARELGGDGRGANGAAGRIIGFHRSVHRTNSA